MTLNYYKYFEVVRYYYINCLDALDIDSKKILYQYYILYNYIIYYTIYNKLRLI